MWNGFCGDLIRKTNQRLLVVVLVLAVGLVLFFGYEQAYFRGFFLGPQTAMQSELLSARDAAAFPNAILKVDGGATAGTDLFELSKDDAHPQGYVSARYLATEIGGKLLLVRVSPNHPLVQPAIGTSAAGTLPAVPSMTLTGRVLPLTPIISQRLSAATAAGDEAYLPYLLDAYDYKTFGWVSAVVGGLLLLASLWGTKLYLQRSSDPAQAPLARGLAKYGPLESVVPQLDAEMASAHTTFSRRMNSVLIGTHWMLIVAPFRCSGCRLDGLVWVYRLVVKRKMYFVIPAGTRHTLMAYDRTGQRMAVQLDEAKTGEVIQLLRSVAPQAVYGYDKRLFSLWRANRRTISAGFITQAQSLIAGQTLPESVTRRQYSGG